MDNELKADWAKKKIPWLSMLKATVRRDALLAWSYPFAFLARWLTLPMSLVSSFFLSHLVGGTPHFGHATQYFSYVCINLTFLSLAAAALQSVPATIRLDQFSGTLEPMIACGAAPAVYILSTSIWPLCIALIQAAVSVTFASLVLGFSLHHCNVVSLFCMLFVGLGTMGALGIASAAAVIAFKQLPPSGYLVGGAATFLSGALFPIDLLPPPLRLVSWLLPLTHAMRGLRGAVAGMSLKELMPDFIWLTGVMLIALPLSCWAVHCSVQRSIADGSLNNY